jgi:hypothetical protein
VRRFGVEASDFFVLVEKLHRTVQQHMHINPRVGVRSDRVGDLKERAFKGDGVVLSDGAFCLKHRTFSIWVELAFLQAGLRLGGRLGEFAVMFGEIALEHDLPLGVGFSSC